MLICVGLSGCTESKDKFVGVWDDGDYKWKFLEDGRLLQFGYIELYYKVENNNLYLSHYQEFPTNMTEVWECKFYGSDTFKMKCIMSKGKIIENGSI